MLSFCLFSFGFFGLFSSPANAIDYDVDKLGSYLFNASDSYILKSDGSTLSFSDNGNGISLSTTMRVVELHLKFDRVIPANSMVNFFISASGDANQTSMPLKAYFGKAYIYETSFVNWVTSPLNTGSVSPANPLYSGAGVVNVKFITTQDTDELTISFDIQPTGYMSLAPGSYIGLVSQTAGFQSIEDQLKANQDQAHQDSQAQKEATEQQTQQQKEQYEQEKEEEKQREDSASEDGGKLAGIFNITLLNPFAGIWELFNPGGCTSIPTIASWVHSEDTVYCSWWPQSIRATLTPVFSLAAMMLLFGFVAKWLGGNEGINVRFN